jgi:NADPH:quinone reductase-like Zn-dependent oxidoreductase
MSPFSSHLPRPNFSMPAKEEAMAVLREFAEAGKLTPVIDRTYPLSDVCDAIEYLEQGDVRGKVVICQ